MYSARRANEVDDRRLLLMHIMTCLLSYSFPILCFAEGFFFFLLLFIFSSLHRRQCRHLLSVRVCDFSDYYLHFVQPGSLKYIVLCSLAYYYYFFFLIIEYQLQTDID